MKKWYKSKINWSAIILALLAIFPAIIDLLKGIDFSAMNAAQYATFIISVLIIVFRNVGELKMIKTKRNIRRKRPMLNNNSY